MLSVFGKPIKYKASEYIGIYLGLMKMQMVPKQKYLLNKTNSGNPQE